MIAWIYSGSVGRSAVTTGGENQMVGGQNVFGVDFTRLKYHQRVCGVDDT